MRTRAGGIGFGIIFVLGSACSHPTDTPPGNEPRAEKTESFSAAPSPQIARQAIAKHALVLDVRTETEFATGHLAGAHLLPVQEMAARMPEIKKWADDDLSRPVVVYCRSGKRASQAARMLHDAGFEHVVNGGGLQDLQDP